MVAKRNCKQTQEQVVIKFCLVAVGEEGCSESTSLELRASYSSVTGSVGIGTVMKSKCSDNNIEVFYCREHID